MKSRRTAYKSKIPNVVSSFFHSSVHLDARATPPLLHGPSRIEPIISTTSYTTGYTNAPLHATKTEALSFGISIEEGEEKDGK